MGFSETPGSAPGEGPSVSVPQGGGRRWSTTGVSKVSFKRSCSDGPPESPGPRQRCWGGLRGLLGGLWTFGRDWRRLVMMLFGNSARGRFGNRGWCSGGLWSWGVSLTIEARKSFCTGITDVISNAAVQAYIGPVTLGTAVDCTVPLLSTLVTRVGMAFVLNG